MIYCLQTYSGQNKIDRVDVETRCFRLEFFFASLKSNFQNSSRYFPESSFVGESYFYKEKFH